MLNLLYYDIKATVKKCWYYIAIMAVMALIVRFLCSDAFVSFFKDLNFIYGVVIGVVASGFLGAFGILITIIIIVRIEQWFDENILSAQGQLTNMLPVPSWQIVLSKILTVLIWSIIIMVMAIGVICVVMVGTDYFESFATTLVEIGANNNIEISISGLMVTVGIYFASGITAFSALCFTVQMVGQLFGSYRNIGILIAFIVILAISLFIEYKIALIFGIVAPDSIETSKILSFCIMAAAKLTLINIIMSVIYWGISSFILKRFLKVV